MKWLNLMHNFNFFGMHKTSPFNNITLYADVLYFQIYFQLQGLFYSDTKVLLKNVYFNIQVVYIRIPHRLVKDFVCAH